jgi:hypothetical protein
MVKQRQHKICQQLHRVFHTNPRSGGVVLHIGSALGPQKPPQT